MRRRSRAAHDLRRHRRRGRRGARGLEAPGSSFGSCIGSPFLRLQPWWPYLREFTGYLAFCGQELERGHPVIDILLYLGDDVNHRPSEHDLLFDNRYKYDYLNTDALMTRVSVNGREAARLWCPPYACDISGFVKPGENKLRVEVTSTIYNRLAIDAGKPEGERTTWTLCGPKKGAPLHESGLLGPVTLRVR